MGNLYGKFLPMGERDEFLFAVEEGVVTTRLGGRGRPIIELGVGVEVQRFQDIDGNIVDRKFPKRGEISVEVFASDDPEGRIFEVRCSQWTSCYGIAVHTNGQIDSIGMNARLFDHPDDISDLQLELMLR